MSKGRWIPPHVVGECRFDSSLFSNTWTMSGARGALAELWRDPSRHTSSGRLEDGARFRLYPDGWGTIVVATDDEELGRIDRRSWWGRRWEISGSGFGCDLTSDPLPRRWTLRLGSQPIGRIAGSAWSYNRMVVHTDISVPIHALVLAWHVLARPWEQAASPRSLIPDRPVTA